MTISIALLTSENLGLALVRQAQTRFSPDLPREVSAIALNLEAQIEVLQPYISNRIDRLNHGNGVLLLTDLAGSAPDRLARSLAKHYPYKVVSGLNLAMLLAVLEHESEDLATLVEVAYKAGRDAIRL